MHTQQEHMHLSAQRPRCMMGAQFTLHAAWGSRHHSADADCIRPLLGISSRADSQQSSDAGTRPSTATTYFGVEDSVQLLRQSLAQAADAQRPINGIFGAFCLHAMSLNPHADAWLCGSI